MPAIGAATAPGEMRGRRDSGQATVEFALACLAFLLLALGVIDVSRAVFTWHGVNRAAESTAHGLMVQYNATHAAIGSSIAWPAIQTGQQAGHVGVSTTKPLCVSSGVGYQEINNRASCAVDTRSVYICGVPDLTAPNLIQVTIQSGFQPASSLFIGGLNVPITAVVSVLTVGGEKPGVVVTNTCPAH